MLMLRRYFITFLSSSLIWTCKHKSSIGSLLLQFKPLFKSKYGSGTQPFSCHVRCFEIPVGQNTRRFFNCFDFPLRLCLDQLVNCECWTASWVLFYWRWLYGNADRISVKPGIGAYLFGLHGHANIAPGNLTYFYNSFQNSKQDIRAFFWRFSINSICPKRQNSFWKH